MKTALGISHAGPSWPQLGTLPIGNTLATFFSAGALAFFLTLEILGEPVETEFCLPKYQIDCQIEWVKLVIDGNPRHSPIVMMTGRIILQCKNSSPRTNTNAATPSTSAIFHLYADVLAPANLSVFLNKIFDHSISMFFLIKNLTETMVIILWKNVTCKCY